MGLFKSIKDMTTMVNAAPGLIEQANQLGAQAYQQQMNAQTMQAMYAEPQAGGLDPIAGVDLEKYARISKGIAPYGYDAAKLPIVAATFGVNARDWATAQAGWAARIQADRGVGRRFNEIYQAV